MSAGGAEQRIRSVAAMLGRSLGNLLQHLPGAPHRPNQLAQTLRLNRDITGRVLSAARSEDPFQIAHIVPGPEPLRKLLRAARRRRVPPNLIAQTETAIRDFESLTRELAGDRPGLDAILSTMQPEARQRFELATKQSIFKGVSLLKGAMAETWLHVALVHPSADKPTHHDVLHVYGTLGLRRVRPNAVVKFAYQQFGVPTGSAQTVDRQSLETARGDELDRFCVLAPAALDAMHVGTGAMYALAAGTLGPDSAADKLLAELRPAAMARTASSGARARKSLFVAPSIPVKLLHFDMLLHKDAYPGSEPQLLLYDTAVEGMASVNDESRDADRLDLSESLTVLGRQSSNWQFAELPAYLSMLRFVCQKVGWDLDRFRGYRTRIQYPMHGLQACMAFDAPAATH